MPLETLPKKLSKQDEAKIAAEILKVWHDLLYFLEEYVWTLDEDADTRNGEDPVKRFPSLITQHLITTGFISCFIPADLRSPLMWQAGSLVFGSFSSFGSISEL